MLASALTRAIPANYPASWTSDADYPAGAKKRGEEGTVGFSLLISPEGKVARCYITQSSGFPELDRITCVAISTRAQFKPAADENGQPVYDTYTGRLTWRHPNRSSPPPHPASGTLAAKDADMELQVKQLPGGLQEQEVLLRVRIDTSGHIAYCEQGQDDKSPAPFPKIACTQAKNGYEAVTKNDAGEPISLMRGFRVLFKVAPL
jgi:TonB family protein